MHEPLVNNQADKALNNFIQLKEYPGDLEIELNYAEALLWNKKPKPKHSIANLSRENPTNFVAHLGYANTLSNLKNLSALLCKQSISAFYCESRHNF
jgi:hypothetical protein